MIELSKKTQWAISVLLLVILGLMLFNNSKGILLNCFHATDFGIYQEAIYDIAHSFELNPFNAARNIKIFNDHFDPIIFFAAPFVALTNYNPLMLIIFEMAWLWGLFFFLFKSSRSTSEFIWYSLMLIMTKGMLTGFTFPIHPTSWSILPAVILAKKILEDDRKWILIMAAIVILFREAFSFGIVGLAGYYFIKRDYKFGAALLSIALINLVFVFIFRPMIWGEVVRHSNTVLGGGVLGILKKLFSLDRLPFVKVFLPFFIPLFFIFRERIKEKDWLSRELGVIAYFFPLFLMHWLANKFHFQYGVLVIAPIFGLIIFAKDSKIWMNQRKWFVTVMLLFVVSSMGTHTKIVKAAVSSKNKSCSFDEGRVKSIETVNKYFYDKKGPFLATGGAIPSLMRPGMDAYQAGVFGKKMLEFTHLLIEKPGTGNHYPFNPTQIASAIEICKNENIVINDDWFVVIERPSKACSDSLNL